MDNRAEIRDFLTSRRARLTPEQAGLRDYGGTRRVPGLRRSELAGLAGLSVEYVTQLERGNLGGASDSALDALARALQLDEAERTHLYDLARAAAASGRSSRRRRTATLRPSLYRVLDTVGAPAFVSNSRGDVVAANQLAFALYSDILSPQALPFSMPRFMFLDRRADAFFLDWDTLADDTVAALRIEAGRNPTDRQLSDLVGELATRSDAFATRWAKHNVRLHRTGTKRLLNPVIGEIELTADALELPGEDLALIVYTAPADSSAQEKLHFLAQWSGPEPRATSLPAAAPDSGESAATAKN